MWFLKWWLIRVDNISALLLLSLVFKTTQAQEHLSYAPEYDHPEYAFSYGVKDLQTKDVKSQWESREGGVINGHYSILEPDGSIRTVDYTADAKNGFNAVVKTHGPHVHPITEKSHDTLIQSDDTSQSKINHYSQDQDHIVLSSDIKPVRTPLLKLPPIPSLLKVKPHGRIRHTPITELQPVVKQMTPVQNEYYYKEVQPDIRTVPSPDVSNYNKAASYPGYTKEEDWTAVVNEHQYNSQPQKQYFTNHQANKIPNSYYRKPMNVGRTSFTSSKKILYRNQNSESHDHGHIEPAPAYDQKHYTTFNKYHKGKNEPLDYSSYFQKFKRMNKVKSTGPVVFPSESKEQRAASARIVQSMIRRDKKHIVPRYARYSTNTRI